MKLISIECSSQDEDVPKKGIAAKSSGDRVEMTMKKMWFKWTNENHTFESVTLSKADIAAFSGAVREYIDHDRDEMGKPKPDGRSWLPSLKYTFAAVPKPNEKPKALTNDQKQQNLVFTRECKKLWKEALNELRERVVEGVKKMEMKKNRNSSGDYNNESSMKEVESERKSKSDGDRSRERGSKERDDSDAVSISSSIKGNNNKTSKYELSVLNDLSLKTLREWVEEDEDKLLEKEKEKLREKNEEAKKMHQQFVRKKDGLRIRLPDPSEMPRAAIPRMDYANKADAPV